ncbi:MAG TPA: A/G-specific adenine glycosylase [Planctomycetota bacterium]|jgi:A/G-specific adenine glycosylase
MRIAAPLLRWFRAEARDLPWRRTRDPYAIWISEVMLQQTQIATVLPYFERWMRRFPNVEALAWAPIDGVLKAWEGLGYYARARNLHKAAALLARDGFPKTREAWEKVPGVGPYTAAAIASIARGERTPVCDGNVRRVVARLLRIEEVITSRKAAARVGKFLASQIPADAPGDFNQALMELGQRICAPRKPKCAACPLRRGCRARKAGVQDRLPVKVARRRVPHYEIGIGVCFKAGKILVARRPPEGLLGGLWEFPGGKREPRERFERTVAREFREEVGLDVEVGEPIVTVPHRYSHFSVEVHAYRCRWKRGRARPRANSGVRWVAPEDLEGLAFPAANRRILAAVLRGLK